MGLFHKATEEEKFIAKEMKILEDKAKRTLKFADYAGILALSKDTFERTCDLERLNALKKREAGMSDVLERSRIHDACVSLLAVQEAEFELSSARGAQDLKEAEANLKKLLRKLYRISMPGAVSKKEYKETLGMQFDDAEDPTAFSERAEMVDEKFVEWIIQGYSVKDCIKKCTNAQVKISSVPGVDFSSGPGAEDDISIIKSDAEAH